MKQVNLYLINHGEYQLSLQREAEKTAVKFGFDLQVFFADDDPAKQQKEMFDAVFGRNNIERPHAIIASLAKYGKHADAVMDAAAQRGVHVIYVNHVSPKLKEYQSRFLDKVLLAFVGPDQYKAGRIQGEQVLRLMPEGGEMLYITGPSQSFAAAERKRGTMEVIGKLFDITEQEGDWTVDNTKAQVLKRLEWLAQSSDKIKLCVVAQSDPMGKGAREALIEIDRKLDSERRNRLNLTKVPVLGIDGLDHGKRWVGEGVLQGTVAMESCTRQALELIDRFDRERKGDNIFLEPEAHPVPQALRPALIA